MVRDFTAVPVLANFSDNAFAMKVRKTKEESSGNRPNFEANQNWHPQKQFCHVGDKNLQRKDHSNERIKEF